MPISSTYEIRLMNKNDFDQVLSLLTNSFFQDEPITRCLQVTETLQYGKNAINDCLKHPCSFIAYDRETNEIIGVCLNQISNKDSKHEYIEYEEKLLFIIQLLDDIHKKVNVFNQLNVNTFLYIYIINVDKKARGSNLATCLISKSIEHAKTIFKVDGAYAEATSIYSLKSFQQEQFRVINELKYIDYNSERLASLNDKMYDRCYLVARKF